MATLGPLTAFEETVIRKLRAIQQTMQSAEMTMAFHPRGKDSFWEHKTISYERFRLVTDQQFLSVE